MDYEMKPWPALAPCGKTLSLKGGGLFYYDLGPPSGESGRPALILLHGLGDEADTWRHLLPLLARAGYRLIAPDLPGFGRSLWKGKISVNRHAEAVLALMTASGAASPAHPAVLAGNSMGAGIAEIIALKRPDLARALILLDGCIPVSGGPGKETLLMELSFIARRWYRSFRHNHRQAWESLYSYYCDLDALPEADRAFLRERVIARVESANQERGYLASLRSMNRLLLWGRAGFSFFPRFSNFTKFAGKILLIWGEQDRVITPERIAGFRALRPDAGFITIAGAGHLPQQEKPDETAQAMLDFLQVSCPKQR
jgi:pimeloyl-ACP methyl ester carboxylesterase